MSVGAFDLSQLPAGWQPIPERTQSTLTDSNRSTAQTVRAMCQLIRDAVDDPKVWACASDCLRFEGFMRAIGLPAPEGAETAAAVFWWVKHKVKFVLDEDAVLALYGETDQVDFLMSPSVLLRMHRPAEDCDGQTMLTCVLLCALMGIRGVGAEIATVKADRQRPGEWTHVYPRAVLPDGRRLSIDTTNGVGPGWEVPAWDVQEKQIWDLNGNPVEDSAPVVRSRMHGYVGRCGMGCAQRRGMGDDSGISDTVMSSTDALSTFGPDLTNTGGYVNPTQVYLPSGSIAPYSSGSSGSSVNWTQILSGLTNLGTRLGSMALLPSGSSLLPSGAVISPSGAATGLLTSGSVGGISLTSILLIGGLGLAVLMIAGKK